MIRVSRKQALAAGAKYYFTGEPCKRGHVRVRAVSNSGCKGCSEITIRAWKANNRDKTRRWGREYHLRNVKARQAAGRAYQRRRSGLPEPTRPCPERCENCGRLPGRRHLALDHCHVTGKFRGWLCFLCNSGLGKLGDTLAAVLRTAEYLRRAA